MPMLRVPMSFGRPRSFLQYRNGVDEIACRQYRRPTWIVGRDLVHHALLRIPGTLSPHRREAALALKVARWEPSGAAGHMAHWHGDKASVFFWSASTVAAAMAEHGFRPRLAHVVPETFLQPPLHDGVRLTQAIGGFEGQVWRDGILEASRWWPEAPSDEAWSLFLRGAGHLDPIVCPETQVLPLMDRPWVPRQGMLTAGPRLPTPLQACAAAVAVLMLPIGYDGARYARLRQTETELRSQLAATALANGTILTAREVAIGAAQRARSFLAFEAMPQPLEIMAEVTGLLDGLALQTETWSFDSRQLTLHLVSSTEIDSAYLVRIFEEHERFQNVTGNSEADRRAMTLKAHLIPVGVDPS
jgi:hypothetical protein